MSWIGGAFKAVTGFFSGNTGARIIDAADELHLSAEERQTIDQKDLASARSMQAASGNTGFDILVNCISRTVRPVATYWLLGGLANFWTLPSISSVDTFYQSLIYLVFTFWFGGRAITQDIPKMLAALRAIKK